MLFLVSFVSVLHSVILITAFSDVPHICLFERLFLRTKYAQRAVLKSVATFNDFSDLFQVLISDLSLNVQFAVMNHSL